MRNRHRQAKASASRSRQAPKTSRPAMWDLLPHDQPRRVGNVSLIRRMRQVFRRQDTQSSGGDAYIRDRLDQHLQ